MKTLTEKEAKRRDFILTGNLWKVVIQVTLPLLFYGLFNYLYGFIDLIIVSFIGQNEMASVVFIDEIKNAIIAFGAAIAAAGTVLVARSYGAGDFDEARKNAGTSFVLALLVGVGIVLLTVIFGKELLKLLNAPDEIITTGIGYFNYQMISTALIAVNSVFIGLEKAKGNTHKVLIINLISMGIKIVLSLIFVFVMYKGTTYMAIATLISTAVMTVIACIVMTNRSNIFQIRFKDISLKKQTIMPIITLALPVFLGKFLFSMGKVAINSLAAIYGSVAVAAFGISMKIGGGGGTLALVFEESETAIISQNLGNKRLDRSVKAYKISQFYGFIFALFGMTTILLLFGKLVPIFSANTDPMLQQMITDIYRFEKFSAITSSGIAIITGMFIGFKLPKIGLWLNIVRLFIFRIPFLLILLAFDVDYRALGYTMFFSNLSTLIVALILMLGFMRKIHQFGYDDLHLHSVED